MVGLYGMVRLSKNDVYLAFFWWKMPLGEQGSVYTLNANKNFAKPPAVLNTKAQLANWQVTSTQASWAERACAPADLRILRYVLAAIQEICQPYLQNQPIRQSSCDTTYLSMFSQKNTLWVPRFDDVNQGSLTDNLGKHPSIQMGCIPWLCSEWPAAAEGQFRTSRPVVVVFKTKVLKPRFRVGVSPVLARQVHKVMELDNLSTGTSAVVRSSFH